MGITITIERMTKTYRIVFEFIEVTIDRLGTRIAIAERVCPLVTLMNYLKSNLTKTIRTVLLSEILSCPNKR